MKNLIIILVFVLYINAIENNTTKPYKSKENLGIPLPFEREVETIEIIKDKVINYDKTLKSIKKAYSKPVNNDFKYLKELENNTK